MKGERIALVLFLCAIAGVVFTWGFYAGEYRIFPYSIVSEARKGLSELKTRLAVASGLSEAPEEQLPPFYRHPREEYPPFSGAEGACPGPTLVTGVGPGNDLFARIIDTDGTLLHEWIIDWFRLWPDADHLPDDIIPQSKPGTLIHGAVVLDDGDLVFSFTYLGLVRLRPDGEIVWRLPYRTHHSLELDGEGTLWACGQRRRVEVDPNYPHRQPPFDENTIVRISTDGEILEEWSVPRILHDGGRPGILDMLLKADDKEQILDDRLHMNDVQPFPVDMENGFFGPGDLFLSFCEINTIVAFNRHTGEIKFVDIGSLVHQHDIDFIDGNTISVFDNRREGTGSRVAIIRPDERTTETAYESNESTTFCTNSLGNHQWLPNGNLLLSESWNGRVFEVNKEGDVVWQYVNYVDDGVVGLVSEALRLPEEYGMLYTPGR